MKRALVLYDSATTRQFIAQLPQTITMTNYGGREVYSGINQAITVEGEGQLRFDDGDITYGKVTSDLSVFPDLPSRVEITFEVMSK